MKWSVKLLSVLLFMLLVSAIGFARPKQEEVAAEEEPVTITMTTYHAEWVDLANVENFSETVVAQVIKDELNIIVKPSSKPAETLQALLVDLAADELPDISTFWRSDGDEVWSTMVKAATEEMLAPLDDAIKKHGPIIDYALKQEEVAEQIEKLYFLPEFNGKIYMVPCHYGLYNPWISGHGLYIRGDVADKLNIPTPDPSINTTDDLYELLVKIKNAGIVDINGKPVYPIGSFTWNGILFGSMSRPFSFGGTSFIGVENGKLKAFVKTDYAWKNILWIRRLVKDGLVDPEMFTDDYTRMTEKIAQGRFAVWPIFASFAVTPLTHYVRALLSAAPEMAYRPLGNMVTHRGNKNAVLVNDMETGLCFAVSSKANVDAAIRLVNWLNTRDGRATARYGKKDEQWFWNDKGYAEMYPEFYKMWQEDRGGYAGKHGTIEGAMILLTEVTGLDNEKYDVTGSGVDDVRDYQNAPDDLNKINAARKAVFPVIEVVTGKALNALIKTYPDREQFEPVWNQFSDIMSQCYLVDTDEEAKQILERYRETLDKNGYEDFIAYAQKEYDANPGYYADYLTW